MLVQERGLQSVFIELTNGMMIIKGLFFTPISYTNCARKLHSIYKIKIKFFNTKQSKLNY